VIPTQNPAPPGENVLVQFAPRPVLTRGVQVASEVAGGGEGVGMILTEDLAEPGEGVLVQFLAASYSPSVYRVTARLLAQPSVSGWSSPSTWRSRATVSSFSVRASP
jgi:hypothetical protein